MAKLITLPHRVEGPEPRVKAWVQLARTFEQHHRWMLGMLSPHGLTGPQFDVLATIQFRGGLTQQEVAQNLLVTKGNIALVPDSDALGWEAPRLAPIWKPLQVEGNVRATNDYPT